MRSGADGPGAVEPLLPAALARVGRREAALDHRALAGQLDLVVDRDRLARIVGVSEDHVLDPLGERGVDDGERIGGRDVAGAEHHPVLGGERQHVPGLREHLPVGVEHRHRLGPDPLLPELELELRPDGQLRLRARGRKVRALVLGVDGRQPDLARSLPRRDLDGDGVDAADRPVEDDRPEHLDARHGLPHHRRPLGGRVVVGLQAEAGQPELGEAPRQADVVDPALDHVRGDVDVEVEGAADQIPRGVRGSLGRLAGRAHAFAGSSITGVP